MVRAGVLPHFPLGVGVEMRGDQNAASIVSTSARQIEGSFAAQVCFSVLALLRQGR